MTEAGVQRPRRLWPSSGPSILVPAIDDGIVRVRYRPGLFSVAEPAFRPARQSYVTPGNRDPEALYTSAETRGRCGEKQVPQQSTRPM